MCIRFHVYVFLACEQAFSRAAWGEGKAKRPVDRPPFPSLSSLFFPKQRACSQANVFLKNIHVREIS